MASHLVLLPPPSYCGHSSFYAFGWPPGGSRAPLSAVSEVITALFCSVLNRYQLEHPGFIPHPDIERDFSWFCQASLPTHPDAAYDIFLDLIEAVEEDPFGHTVHASTGWHPTTPPPPCPLSAEPALMQTSSLTKDIKSALAVHDQRHAAPVAAVPPPIATLSIQMLISMLAIWPLDEFQGLDSEYMGLLRDLFMHTSSLLDFPAIGISPGLHSGSAPAPPAPTPPAAVQPTEWLTKPTTPPLRPLCSPTHPPTCPIRAKKPSYAAAAAAVPATAAPLGTHLQDCCTSKVVHQARN